MVPVIIVLVNYLEQGRMANSVGANLHVRLSFWCRTYAQGRTRRFAPTKYHDHAFFRYLAVGYGPLPVCMKRVLIAVGILLIVACLLPGCRKKTDAESQPDPEPFKFEVPGYFPKKYTIPTDNPVTEQGVSGRRSGPEQ